MQQQCNEVLSEGVFIEIKQTGGCHNTCLFYTLIECLMCVFKTARVTSRIRYLL